MNYYTGQIIYYTYIGEGIDRAISVNVNIVRGLLSFVRDIDQVLADEDTCFGETHITKRFYQESSG